MQILSQSTLSTISSKVSIPSEEILHLPEKVLQFGTGVLLRGLCDDFIDRANKQGIFNGRIVVVKSTDRGDSSAFDAQNGLFTLAVKGLQEGVALEEYHINAAISRTLSASSQWAEILACAKNAAMNVVVSNTTEVGIEYVEESISGTPPRSFPAKLLAFLHERFVHVPTVGCVIVATELITDNGSKLKEICLKLAHFNNLSNEFIVWLDTQNEFCNSLVDRIVPGKPEAEILSKIEEDLGYRDNLLVVAEIYRLWAIQGGERAKKALSFAAIDPAVIIADDIEIYRELKLRLLNGTHSLTCGLAYLSGNNFVRENMANAELSAFVSELMLEELAPAIPYSVDKATYTEFGESVLSRFANPFLNHKLLDITLHYSSKMKARNVPLLLTHYERVGGVPLRLAKGFAGYLSFMKPVHQENNQYFGQRNGEKYLINDAQAPYFYTLWQNQEKAAVVKQVLENEELWGANLYALPGFYEAVLSNV